MLRRFAHRITRNPLLARQLRNHHALSGFGCSLGVALVALLAWAVADRISVKRRAAAGLLRAAPQMEGRASNDAIAVVGGLALYALTVVWLHAWLLGVRPMG